MKFNDLNLKSKKAPNRIGRGISAGQGKTAGRGTKGQGARTGSKRRPGFSGGQNPMMQQLPKLPGFKTHKTPAENVTTTELEALKVKTIDPKVLFEHQLISSPYVKVKLLNKAKLSKPLEVNLAAASQSAIYNVEQAGGTFNKTKRTLKPKTKTSAKEE
jgi:large subunit ribosomal protein L15